MVALLHLLHKHILKIGDKIDVWVRPCFFSLLNFSCFRWKMVKRKHVSACEPPHWLAVLVLEALYLSVHKQKRHDMFLGNCDPCVSILKAHGPLNFFCKDQMAGFVALQNKEEKCPTLSKNLHRYQELPYLKGDTSKGDASSKNHHRSVVCWMFFWCKHGFCLAHHAWLF